MRWAQVGDHDNDAVARVAERVARAVLLDRQLPACAAAGTGAGALVMDVSLMAMMSGYWKLGLRTGPTPKAFWEMAALYP